MNGPGPKLRPLNAGTRVTGKDGSAYIVDKAKGGGTLRRATPKVKGKAARRADKLARRLLREGVTA